MIQAGHVACNVRGKHGISVGKMKGMRPLGRSRCRWKDNIEQDLGETEWAGMEGSCEHSNDLQVP
jgi:hypothetical protein